MLKSYYYSSIFANYIKEYVKQRRLSGFSFEAQAYRLYKFDQYCNKIKLSEPILNKQLFDSWSVKSSTESKTTQSGRLSTIRGFCIYLNAIGIVAYIPHHFSKCEKVVPHLMIDEEIKSFFKQVDNYKTLSTSSSFIRLEKEYKILFRLIYCCGLRNSEACNLKFSDVDTTKNILTIIHSKGDKDRVVYISGDLSLLCEHYKNFLINFLGVKPFWFFPGRKINAPIQKTSVDKKFNEFWNKSIYAKDCDKKPTVHCLRHSFVIKRMNLWMSEGIDLNVMMPYLSQYLGHSSPEETYYYFHQVQEIFETIKKKDSISTMVIPEVDYE